MKCSHMDIKIRFKPKATKLKNQNPFYRGAPFLYLTPHSNATILKSCMNATCPDSHLPDAPRFTLRLRIFNP